MTKFYFKLTILVLFIICLIHVDMFAQTKVKVIAHRGYWKTENSAQNSIIALYKANQVGLYGSEFDVLITSDGIPVVNHDDIVDGKDIQETSYNELREIKIKNGEILPTLDQYLVHAKACKGTKLILEIKPHKTKEKEYLAVQKILDLVDKYQLIDEVEYISFSMNICKEIKKKQPNAIVAYLNGDIAPSEIKEIGLTGIDYNYKVLLKNPDWIKQAKDSGLSINSWTVNKPEVMQELIDYEIDYITTDEPLVLKGLLEKK